MQLQDFLGTWRLERQITDRLGLGSGAFRGEASLTGNTFAAVWHESGQLTLTSGAVLNASRTYLWRAAPDGIQVDFHDGRPFHVMNASAPQGEHWCDPDQYRVDYDFSRWPEWWANWDVQGPRKSFHMQTRHWRA